MKPHLWLPVVVFLAVSVPVVVLLNLLDVASEYRVWIALAAGALATALTQNHLKNRADRASEKE